MQPVWLLTSDISYVIGIRGIIIVELYLEVIFC